MRVVFVLLLLLCQISTAVGQSADFPLGHNVYQKVDRENITGEGNFFTTVKPYAREDTYDFLKRRLTSYYQKEMKEFSNDSLRSEKPFLKNIYVYPEDLYYYKNQNLELHLNPAVQFSFGTSNEVGSDNLFVSSRGVEIRGTIDEKVTFYTYLTENQARYPQYVNAIRDSTLVVPYEGFWKQFSGTGVDFFRAQGYIDFGISPSISAQFGFGKHFVGNGVRSLILSDYSNNYPYLRINTKTSIFEYTNVFAELIADVQGGTFGILGTGGFSKKYMAFHHLNVQLRSNLSIGLFESVMYGDSTQGLKIEYMNPIIFYRAIEQQNGSEDNAIVGLDFKWNILNRFSLYGQLVIDELLVKEAFSGNGSWRNKQGIQLGGKYIDAFGVDDLFVQGELNKVRPYTYAHEDGFTNYSHYNLSLAHPLGANFTEYLGRLTYPLNEKWQVEGVLMLAKYGNDIGNENFGRDILKDYTIRRSDGNGGSLEFGNDHLQGNETDLTMMFVRTSYMWKHNLFIDLEATIRSEKDALGSIEETSTIFGLSFRWNVPARRYLF